MYSTDYGNNICIWKTCEVRAERLKSCILHASITRQYLQLKKKYDLRHMTIALNKNNAYIYIRFLLELQSFLTSLSTIDQTYWNNLISTRDPNFAPVPHYVKCTQPKILSPYLNTFAFTTSNRDQDQQFLLIEYFIKLWKRKTTQHSWNWITVSKSIQLNPYKPSVLFCGT